MADLQCSNLSFRYGNRKAIEHINLVCSQGSTVIVGENGAGKSTLLRLLATLARPHSGTISFDGTDYSAWDKNKLRRSIGYLDQFPDFPGRFTVRESLEYKLWLYKIPPKQWPDLVEVAAEITRTTAYLERKIKELSGGTQRRVFTAQAIVHQPNLVILDEPASGLDPHQQELLNEVLPLIAQEATLIVASHSIEQVAAIAGQLIILTHGGIAHQSVHASGSLTSEQVKDIMRETMWSE